MKNALLIAVYGLMLCSIVGCANLSDRMLVEPQGASVTHSYVSRDANRTLAIPVSFDVRNSSTLRFVTAKNIRGDTFTVGAFKADEIIEREFRKVVESNFHVVQGDETPLAKIVIDVDKVAVSRVSRSNGVEVSLRVKVHVNRHDDSESAFSQVCTASCKGEWRSETEVPSAFYEGLGSIVRDFLSKWDSGRATATLLKWNDATIPGLKSPELKSIEWEKNEWQHDGVVWLGRCEIFCNDYEGFKARAWATANIAAMCLSKIGNIEPERLRVVYDEENYDSESRKWTLVYRTFARAKMVLDFDKQSRHGHVTGDLGLMNVKADNGQDVRMAAEELKQYVLSEMSSFAGVVSPSVPKGEPWVRFDAYKTDKTYNLITIKFRLL